MRSFAILVACTALAVIGCNGEGATHGAARPPTTTSSHALTTNSATILIPARSARARSGRKRSWVSPSTQSVSITATGTDGYAGYDITAVPSNAPNCTPVTGGRECTLGFVAPPGTDTVAITAYDAADAYNGNPVATATVGGVNITAGAANNPLPFTLGGIVGQAIALSPASFDVTEGTPATYTLSITGYDVDGNPISLYDAPLLVSQTNTDGTYSLSTTSIADSSVTPSVTIDYNGGSEDTTITVSTTSAVTANDYNTQQTSITLTPTGASPVP